MEEVTEEEIKSAITPISTIVLAVSLLKENKYCYRKNGVSNGSKKLIKDQV